MSDRASQFLHAAESSVSAGSASPRDSPLVSRSLKRVAGLESDLPSKRPKLNDSIRELVVPYTKNEATDSKLCRQLADLGVSNPDLNSIALVAQRVSIHVGECAGDLVWRRQLKEQPANKENTRIHEVVKHWPFAMPNLDSGSRGLNVSHKFLRLVQVIESFESYGESFRGVVFVQHQATAHSIAELMPMLSGRLSFVRASIFAWEDSMQMDDAEQVYPANTPDFWKRIPGGSRLFPVLITVGGLEKEYSPILLLTRDLMAPLLPFKLFPPGQVAKIQLSRCSPFLIDSERLALLHSYTLRLCRAVTNRPLTCTVEGAPYFVAPLLRHWNGDMDRLVDAIAWDLVTQAANSWCIPLKYGNAEDVAADIEDAVIVDRTAELTRRYEALRVRQDLSPLSHPEDSPREAAYANLLEYCKAVRKNFEGLDDEGQALIEIESVFATVSHLDPAAPQVAVGPQPPRYLIPELCFKFTVPARTFRTALLLPSIMHRVDSFLLVKEVNARFFRNQISESRLDEAITAPSSRMELNYERLELLGDSFLKYLASVYVFVYQPSTREGALHVARQEIVNNQSLFRAVASVGLPAYIQSRPFSFKAWQPPNYRMVETGSANGNSEVNAKHARERQHKLGDKVVADTAEAILGAAYLTGGRDTALAAAKALNLPFPLIDRWSDLRRNLLVPPAKITAQLKPGAVEAVEKMVGRKITHRHLVAQALTHISMSPYERVSYERLEFIGDAILELLVVRNIFEQDAKLSPGDLTMLKGSMVSNRTLAAICIETGLYEHVMLAPALYSSVRLYAQALEKARSDEFGSVAEGRPTGQYWQEIDAPKAIESMLGAVYLSDDIEAAESAFNALLRPFFTRNLSTSAIAHHPSKLLQERIQGNKCHNFELVKKKTSLSAQFVVHDVVLATGEGVSTALATRQACWRALDALDGDPGFLKICDCTKAGKEEELG
ncbi:hypothetical protein HMN09_00526500 [Mycena chlorophos]|uniref:RNase III domain-containing protein n=1 Tax=Mycena chlorophos TaxID=658473 RepID=A0A8H6WDC9_MYCCL|nr:hypothetical protein HMN09_00526500 [Mycena chlorophos]